MQVPSIERNPIVISEFLARDTGDASDTSSVVFDVMLASLDVLERTYGMGTNGQVSFSENDFLAWLDEHKEAQQRPGYETHRGVTEVSLIMGLDGPHQIGIETDDQTVLEVGPGAGLFARYVVNHAAHLTLVDNTTDFLDRLLIPTDAEIVTDRIQSAELEEASFDKVFDIFAALTWGADMRSTAMAFYKELHLTRTGGSLFTIPLFARLVQRAQAYEHGVLGSDIPPQDAFRDFRDYTLGRSVIRVMSEGLVKPTFGINVWDKAEDFDFIDSNSRYFDSVWAIFDKVERVPNVPPDDLLRLGYDLQDGNKIANTVADELATDTSGFDLSKFSLPAFNAIQGMQ